MRVLDEAGNPFGTSTAGEFSESRVFSDAWLTRDEQQFKWRPPFARCHTSMHLNEARFGVRRINIVRGSQRIDGGSGMPNRVPSESSSDCLGNV